MAAAGIVTGEEEDEATTSPCTSAGEMGKNWEHDLEKDQDWEWDALMAALEGKSTPIESTMY